MRSIDDVDLEAHLPPDVRRTLEREAPGWLALPAGRRARLDYRDDGRVVASVKLQWVIGLTESPRLGPRRTPVTFELLAPNGRPVQVTSDSRASGPARTRNSAARYARAIRNTSGRRSSDRRGQAAV